MIDPEPGRARSDDAVRPIHTKSLRAEAFDQQQPASCNARGMADDAAKEREKPEERGRDQPGLPARGAAAAFFFFFAMPARDICSKDSKDSRSFKRCLKREK